MPEKSFVPIPGFLLCAEALICNDIPTLFIQNVGIETTSHAGDIKRHFKGMPSNWPAFVNTVSEWYQRPDTQKLFDACKDIPVHVDHYFVHLQNPLAMGAEFGQVGAEITLSARFWENVLMPVLHSSLTMKSLGAYTTAPVDPSTLQWTFGDSFIIPKPDRIDGHQPDVVLKTNFDGRPEVRMIGELKSCATVPLQDMVKLAKANDGTKLFAILGQIVLYMLKHKTKYGFLSNYTHTVFLSIQEDPPKLLFSDPIPHTNKAIIEGEKVPSISVRLALLYLTLECLSPQNWRLNPKLATTLENTWISGQRQTSAFLGTPGAYMVPPQNPSLMRHPGRYQTLAEAMLDHSVPGPITQPDPTRLELGMDNLSLDQVDQDSPLNLRQQRKDMAIPPPRHVEGELSRPAQGFIPGSATTELNPNILRKEASHYHFRPRKDKSTDTSPGG